MKSRFKLAALLLLVSLLTACNNSNEIDQLKQRITMLEQKIELLTNASVPNPYDSNTLRNTTNESYGTPVSSGRCQGMTKKGTQCKRRSKGNGYCWQHGG